jgi:hypothetical protein
MLKFAPRHAGFLFAFLMSVLMAIIMTCLVTFINTGAAPGFLARWARAFVIAWPIAFVCILILAGRVRRLVSLLTTN